MPTASVVCGWRSVSSPGITKSYNNANMLLSRAGQVYTNDLNGNTLTGGGRTNTWDGQNRLVSSTFNGTTSTFTYGADGLRRRMVSGSNTTDYVLDGQSVVRTLLNGIVDRTYLLGPRGPEYERVGNNAPTWYLYDGLGSVLGTVDAAGNIVSARKYDVYGAVRQLTGSSGTRHKFVGNLGHPSDDETGLIYMRARYYDPVTGRFVSEDPARDGKNWFVYASDAPLNYVDPDGRAHLRLWAVGLAMLERSANMSSTFTAMLPSIQAFFVSGSSATELRTETAMFIGAVWEKESNNWNGAKAHPVANAVGVLMGRAAVAELVIALWL